MRGHRAILPELRSHGRRRPPAHSQGSRLDVLALYEAGSQFGDRQGATAPGVAVPSYLLDQIECSIFPFSSGKASGSKRGVPTFF